MIAATMLLEELISSITLGNKMMYSQNPETHEENKAKFDP